MLVFFNTHISNIITQQFKICCLRADLTTFCPAKPLWPNSCGRLIDSNLLKSLIWFISTVGILMNITSCILAYCKLLPSGDTYNTIVICLSISDAVCCISLLIIILADAIFGKDYINYELYWRRSFFCHCSSVLSVISTLLSIFTINLLTVTRYCIVKSPLDSIFLDTEFLTKICTCASLLVIVLAISLILTYLFTADYYKLPTGLCTLLGLNEKYIISKTFTIITVISLCLSSLTIPAMYSFLLHEMYQSKAIVEATMTSHNSYDGVSKSILVVFTNLLSWIPSVILLCMTFVWNEYPYVLLIWTLSVVMPSNTLINPFAFVFYKLIRRLISNHFLRNNPAGSKS